VRSRTGTRPKVYDGDPALAPPVAPLDPLCIAVEAARHLDIPGGVTVTEFVVTWKLTRLSREFQLWRRKTTVGEVAGTYRRP
jgi:hypothetical protein